MTDAQSFPPEVEASLQAWRLTSDGGLIATPSSWVLPVRKNGLPAVLKIARIPDERCGYLLMRWWDGEGAARVLALADKAILLERATGARSLSDMARSGDDDEACRILCRTAARLHRPRREPAPELHPLTSWFQPLFDLAGRDRRLAPAADAARRLLAEPQAVCPLHGDLHHDNVLDFGDRGWLAIDPHGLLGERAFDYANIFTNPDLADPSRPVAAVPGRFERRLAIVAEAAQLEPSRLLRWIVAWTGLSAAWFIGDGHEDAAAIDLSINAIALRLLG